MNLVVGCDILVKWYNFISPASYVQWLDRFLFGLFYPCLFTAFTLIVLLLMEVYLAMTDHHHHHHGNGSKPEFWGRRLKFVFFPCLILIFAIEIIAMTLYSAREDKAAVIVKIYQIVLGCYAALLLLLGTYFTVKLYRILYAESRNQFLEKTDSFQKSLRNRRILIRICIVTLSFIFCAAVLALVYVVLPQAQACTDTCQHWYIFQFVLCIVEMLACLSIIVTFGIMLRNVVINARVDTLKDMGPRSHTEVQSLRGPSSPDSAPPSFASGEYPRAAAVTLGSDLREELEGAMENIFRSESSSNATAAAATADDLQ